MLADEFCFVIKMMLIHIVTITFVGSVFTELMCPVQGSAIVIGTWYFDSATTAAWEAMVNDRMTPVESLVVGGSVCEAQQCDGSVGYGGSPDENGESTLDAMIMNGKTMDIGAVANLRNIKDAIAVAHAVLVHTEHTMLVGSLATDFAVQMGFQLTNLSTEHSIQLYENWKNNNCQPNYWKGVSPNPRTSCGPYTPLSASHRMNEFSQPDHLNVKSNSEQSRKFYNKFNMGAAEFNHDTLGMVVIDDAGNVAGGTTTNGMTHKIPGRVGDSPIPGSGAYADNLVGGAAATGDGDIMMRFMPSFYAVELMRLGYDAKASAGAALQRIARYYPNFSGAVVAAHINGDYGAACYNMPSGNFPYTVRTSAFNETQILYVDCL